MYPSIMSTPLKFPIKSGEFQILSNDDFNKMEHYKYGIYRVNIEKSDDSNINKLFRFNKYRKYTHTSLEHAKSLNLKITLIQDETANFLHYSPDKLIGCNEVFGEYINLLFPLKERKIKFAKLLINILWGSLCEINKSHFKYKDEDLIIPDDSDIYRITPDDKDTKTLNIICTSRTKFYKTPYARLSPFLISKGRFIISNILYNHRNNIKQIHTDGFISDKLLDNIKTGNEMGSLVYEGKCDNCIINHVNSVEGEFII